MNKSVILFSNNIKQTTATYNYLDKSHKHTIESKKPDTKEHTCMVTLYKNFKVKLICGIRSYKANFGEEEGVNDLEEK